MPMDGGSLPVDIICNSNLDCIAPIYFDCWPGYLVIDHDDTSIEAVRGLEASCNSEIEMTGLVCCRAILVRIGVVQGSRTPWISINSWLERI